MTVPNLPIGPYRITAETPLLRTDSPYVGTLLDDERVIDLPLGFSGGRSPENFAYKLTPSVEGDNWGSRISLRPAPSRVAGRFSLRC